MPFFTASGLIIANVLFAILFSLLKLAHADRVLDPVMIRQYVQPGNHSALHLIDRDRSAIRSLTLGELSQRHIPLITI